MGGGAAARRVEVDALLLSGADGRRRALGLVWSWIQQGKVDTEAEFRALVLRVTTPPAP